jgi:hypothetical protein
MCEYQHHIHPQGKEDEIKEQPKDVGKSKTDFPSFIGPEFTYLPEIGY